MFPQFERWHHLSSSHRPRLFTSSHDRRRCSTFTNVRTASAPMPPLVSCFGVDQALRILPRAPPTSQAVSPDYLLSFAVRENRVTIRHDDQHDRPAFPHLPDGKERLPTAVVLTRVRAAEYAVEIAPSGRPRHPERSRQVRRHPLRPHVYAPIVQVRKHSGHGFSPPVSGLLSLQVVTPPAAHYPVQVIHQLRLGRTRARVYVRARTVAH